MYPFLQDDPAAHTSLSSSRANVKSEAIVAVFEIISSMCTKVNRTRTTEMLDKIFSQRSGGEHAKTSHLQ